MQVPISSGEDCENVLTFFVEKVKTVRTFVPSSVGSLSVLIPALPLILEHPFPVSLPELVRLVGSVKTSSCSLDVLPMSLIKYVFQCIGPGVLTAVNSSLLPGQVADYFKNAVINRPLKKTKLDFALLCHYRPISKL